jgi:phosphopantetheinyl transferase (holo-ACP synthase)
VGLPAHGPAPAGLGLESCADGRHAPRRQRLQQPCPQPRIRSAAEADELESLEDQAALPGRFYEAWTLKEAFAKALRMPLVDALRQCGFTGAASAATGRVPTDRHWRAMVFAPRPQLRLAVVWVADTGAALAAAPSTMEWPPGHAANWPVVRSLGGAGTATC